MKFITKREKLGTIIFYFQANKFTFTSHHPFFNFEKILEIKEFLECIDLGTDDGLI